MADKKVVIPDDLGNNFELNNKKWRVKLGKGLAPNSSGAIALDSNTIGEAIAEAIANAPGTGMGLNKDGKLAVLRSPDPGNLLEVRENGVYYGIYPIQSSFYVDSTEGNDNNDGATPERPMRTIQKAFDSLINGPYNYNIYLRCNKTFEMGYRTVSLVNNVNILPYGPEMSMYPIGYDTDPLYDGTLAVSFPRPTIRVVTKPYDVFKTGRKLMVRGYLECNSVYVSGMKIDIDLTTKNDNGSLQGHIPGIFDVEDRVRFNGCDIGFVGSITDTSNFAYPHRYDSLFRGSSVEFGSCRWRSKTPISTVTYVSTSFISVFDRAIGNIISYDGKYPNYPVFSRADIEPNLPLNTIRRQGRWDTATKTLFGFTTSWDIFQYPN